MFATIICPVEMESEDARKLAQIIDKLCGLLGIDRLFAIFVRLVIDSLRLAAMTTQPLTAKKLRFSRLFCYTVVT